jgi:hypothetical protein
VTITRRKGTRGLACIILAVAIAGGAAVPAMARGVRVHPFTLARVNARCFFAPSVQAMWPIRPFHRPHPIRGGFNEPRGNVPHIGLDIEAPDRAPVYAMTSGRITSIGGLGKPHERFFLAGTYWYWHVTPAAGITDGTYVSRGQLIGHVWPDWRHVHLSELASCGLVDPRRPTGVLHDPANTERPSIGELSAFVANANAYRRFKLSAVASSGGPPDDPAKPVRLNNLHGRIDFRAPISDTPRHTTVGVPQEPLMPSAVRSYLAPRLHPKRRIGSAILAFDGSTLIPASRYFDVLAFGSKRIKSCFVNPKYQCSVNYVFHVAARGFRTRTVPNGRYLYCVQALNINNIGSRQCTPVVIRN